MTQRHLLIERPPLAEKQMPAPIQISVDDRAAIGPWVTTLAARLGYPLVDHFGSPVTYRLLSVSGETFLPTTGRFADARFPSGSRFVLEPDWQRTASMPHSTREAEPQARISISALRIDRRSLMSAGILTTFGLLGFSSGMTTAFAQHLLNQRKMATAPVSLRITFRHHQQTVRTVTWAPDESIVGGIVVLLSVSRMHWQGDLLAFIGGLLLTGYTFLIERFYFHSHLLNAPKRSLRAACGLEWLTMAGETLIVALLFGDWHAVHLLMPSDLLIFSYAGLATTLLPMILMVMMRKYVDGVTLTFIAILEPIADACFAFFFVHEHFLVQVALGGGLAIGSVVLQALTGCLHRQKTTHQTDNGGRIMQNMPMGRRARALLVHLWERPDGVDLFTLQQLTGIPCESAHRLLASLQKRGYVVASHKTHQANRSSLNSAWKCS